MKVAVFYIGTGLYSRFWKDFYISAEKYFLIEDEKKYFVFTDVDNIYGEAEENVQRVPEKIAGWPDGTMYRFRIFAKHMRLYEDFDYMYFFNANVLFVRDVGHEAAPLDRLIVYQHMGYHNDPPRFLLYERNPRSLASIGWAEGKYYVMGGCNGGPANLYKDMIYTLEKAVDIDYNNGILAYSFDESHLNKYILAHSYKMLPWYYMWPEEWEPSGAESPHIILRDKARIIPKAIKAKSGFCNRVVYWRTHPKFFRAYMLHGRFISEFWYYIIRRINRMLYKIMSK
jgi:hypothetical protein